MKDKMRGEVAEIKGKLTGDKVLQRPERDARLRGCVQFKGEARQKVGGVKEAAKSIAYDLDHSSKKGSDAPNAR
jgi:uncharacterized protein YjbJ (UPF0337 family)